MFSHHLYELIRRNPDLYISLCQLLSAYRGAEELRVDIWTVAVELSSLLSAGCSLTEVRLLVAAGYADHAEEVTQPSDQTRSFRPEPRMTFGGQSCVVLTTAGAAWVAQLEDESDLGTRKRKDTGGVMVQRELELCLRGVSW
jgi:hypothetical protein